MRKEDIRIVAVFKPVSDKLLISLEEIFHAVGEELAKNVQEVGIKPGHYSTTAYSREGSRYFKMFLKIRVLPEFDITRQDITEITKKEYKQGIEHAKNTSDTSYWLDIE